MLRNVLVSHNLRILKLVLRDHFLGNSRVSFKKKAESSKIKLIWSFIEILMQMWFLSGLFRLR